MKIYPRIKSTIKSNTKKLILPGLLKYRKFIPENALIIFSDPRGGSTWLAEMLLTIQNVALIWEPLTLWKNSPFNTLKFTYRQYIPETVKWPEAKQIFSDVLSGKAINQYMARINTIHDYQTANNLLIKFCRANGMIPWLLNQFNFKYKPILLIRHPFAVVSSQIKHGNWNYNFTQFTVPESPYNELYKQHAHYLKTLQTKEEFQVALWCLINHVPLRHPQNNKKWITINYENLLLNPKEQLSRIFAEWGISVPSKIEEKINKASSTTKSGSPIEPKYQISYWQKNLTSDQINKMKKVLGNFRCEFYSDDPLPLKSFY